VFSSKGVVFDEMPVLLVFHDLDGDWQFLSSHEEQASEIAFIHLSHLLQRDETLDLLADLPPGWKAWRRAAGDDWVREVTPADQPHVAD
jgi:hypothetical protein